MLEPDALDVTDSPEDDLSDTVEEDSDSVGQGVLVFCVDSVSVPVTETDETSADTAEEVISAVLLEEDDGS